jgi:hypothetical protein
MRKATEATHSAVIGPCRPLMSLQKARRKLVGDRVGAISKVLRFQQQTHRLEYLNIVWVIQAWELLTRTRCDWCIFSMFFNVSITSAGAIGI